MPARVDRYWEEKVKGIKAHHPQYGEPRIWKELQQDDRFGSDGPSQGWVASFLRRIKDEDLTAYRLVSWPDSFERGDLPWEASAATMALLQVAALVPHERPSVRVARWWWKLTQAAPDLPTGSWQRTTTVYYGRYGLARTLAAWEVLGGPPSDFRRAVEWYLACAPWRSKEREDAYQKEIAKGRFPKVLSTIPDSTLWGRLSVSEDTPPDAVASHVQEAVDEWHGVYDLTDDRVLGEENEEAGDDGKA